MKRFYVTSSPESARHILRNTFDEAAAKAISEVQSGTHTRRYIVQIVAVVERASPPVTVRMVDENEA